MRHKKKLIILFLLVLALAGLQFMLPLNSYTVEIYDQYVFRPYQTIRNIVFGYIPISVGDILYLLAGLGILITLGRWIYYVAKFRAHKQMLWASFLNAVIGLATIYLLFFIGWGGNYYKPSLTTYWDLDKTKWNEDSTLIGFDRFLVGKINECAVNYQSLSFRIIDKRAREYYKEYTDRRTRLLGVNTKPSIFGYLMQHLGIQGYYNPFTGEAQVNRFLPSFMLPYVVAHEMAHQAGVAAEDDANLLAYVLSTRVDDTAFRYSAYFNLWLYTNSRLRMEDSTMANMLRDQLNPLTQKHLDTLRDIRRRYSSELSEYSGALYDGYLKLHHQKDGIRSYNRVSASAWAWEQLKDSVSQPPITIP